MVLNKIKLGKYLKIYNEKCNIPDLKSEDVSGINKDKEFFEPSPQVGNETSKYKIVPPGYFACNLMHVGRDVVLPIAYNHTNKNKIVSPAYQVFKLEDNEELLSDYFFLYLKSSERDRYFWFNTDSSVRDGMTWDDFIDVDIYLPSITIQRKYVDIYNALMSNQKSYEIGLEDLKLTCDAFVEQLQKDVNKVSLNDYIILSEEKNENLKYDVESVRGISIDKKFIFTKADMKDVSLKPYYLIKPQYFAYVPVTSRNGEKISLAYNDTSETYICSSSYIVFYVKSPEKLYPGYLRILLSRDEFNRYARFNSWGSARETFDWNEMCNIKIPLPNLEIQKAISEIYDVCIERKKINQILKNQINDICPILIKGSIEEGIKEE